MIRANPNSYQFTSHYTFLLFRRTDVKDARFFYQLAGLLSWLPWMLPRATGVIEQFLIPVIRHDKDNKLANINNKVSRHLNVKGEREIMKSDGSLMHVSVLFFLFSMIKQERR